MAANLTLTAGPRLAVPVDEPPLEWVGDDEPLSDGLLDVLAELAIAAAEAELTDAGCPRVGGPER